jgi:putative aldouronate transport system permease protein
MGVYSEIYPHDITASELKELPNVKGIIINGGPNNVVDGSPIDVRPELYEAASMDGANRFEKMIYITLPALNNTIVTVLVLNLAKVMNLFESVFVLQNDAVTNVSDVLQTYIYTQTFNSGALPDYGYTTAVGLFSSIISCILVVTCNRVSHKTRGRGIV